MISIDNRGYNRGDLFPLMSTCDQQGFKCVVLVCMICIPKLDSLLFVPTDGLSIYEQAQTKVDKFIKLYVH
jgi:hypothetical protein